MVLCPVLAGRDGKFPDKLFHLPDAAMCSQYSLSLQEEGTIF